MLFVSFCLCEFFGEMQMNYGLFLCLGLRNKLYLLPCPTSLWLDCENTHVEPLIQELYWLKVKFYYIIIAFIIMLHD